MKFLLLPKGVVTLTGGSLIWFWKWSLEIINEMKDNLLFVIVFCQFFPFQSLLLWLHFFFQSNIYICQVSKYYINPMEGTSESRLDDQTFSFNVMFVAHNIGWLNKLTKSAHIIRLAYYRLNHGAHHIDSFFDFFFLLPGRLRLEFGFKMFDRLAGNLESSVSFFCLEPHDTTV